MLYFGSWQQPVWQSLRKAHAAMVAAAAAGHVGRPQDIAELVLFLADPDKSGFITGQHFVADGGVTKRMTYPE